MTYTEPGFEITVRGTTLLFSGSLEQADYSAVDAFLQQVDQRLPDPACQLDLVGLTFLNSGGIRSLMLFMLKSAKTFDLRVNSVITWQKESISTFALVQPEKIRIISDQ